MLLSILRVIKFSLQDITRNFGLSFMTVLILVLMLLSVNALVIVNVLTSEAVVSIEDQIDVSVYFDHEATEEEIKEVKDYVDSFPEVTEITYLNKDQVLEQFRERHKDNPDIIASLDELNENPLGPTMIVKTREPSDYEKVIKALGVPEYENIIEAKTFGDTEKAINRVHIITTHVERFGMALSVLFATVAFLIIFNTVRVAIYTQRVEISIKKLVGATNWFVRGPYVFESLLFSILSVLFTYILVIFAASFLDPFIRIVFSKPDLLTSYYNSNFILLFGIQFIAVLLLTSVSSLLAMRRHLRV